jgi:hypothetical protein
MGTAVEFFNLKVSNDFLLQYRSYAKLLFSFQSNTNKQSTIGAKIIQFGMKHIVNMPTSNDDNSFL